MRADAFFIGVLVGFTLAFTATRAERLGLRLEFQPCGSCAAAPSAIAPVAK